MQIIETIKRRWRYRKTWGTPVGRDCISLDTALCRWLGNRLVFLSDHTNGAPSGYYGTNETLAFTLWTGDLQGYGRDLLTWAERYERNWSSAEELAAYNDAQAAMRWVADHLGNLWD